MARNRTTGRFDLAGRHTVRALGLQTVSTESQLRTTFRIAVDTAFMLLTVFKFLWAQHFLVLLPINKKPITWTFL
jgi:hypothetical protein